MILLTPRCRVAIYIYLAGVGAVCILSIANGIVGGGLERHHDLRDWAMLALIYAAISLFWPIVALAIVLQIVGVLPTPLNLG